MKKLLTAVVVFSLVVMGLWLMSSGVARADQSAAPLAAATPTPASINKLPPSGVLPPTPTAEAPSTLPINGGDRSGETSLLLIGLGGLTLAAGVVAWSRRRTAA